MIYSCNVRLSANSLLSFFKAFWDKIVSYDKFQPSCLLCKQTRCCFMFNLIQDNSLLHQKCIGGNRTVGWPISSSRHLGTHFSKETMSSMRHTVSACFSPILCNIYHADRLAHTYCMKCKIEFHKLVRLSQLATYQCRNAWRLTPALPTTFV